MPGGWSRRLRRPFASLAEERAGAVRQAACCNLAKTIPQRRGNCELTRPQVPGNRRSAGLPEGTVKSPDGEAAGPVEQILSRATLKRKEKPHAKQNQNTG